MNLLIILFFFALNKFIICLPHPSPAGDPLSLYNTTEGEGNVKTLEDGLQVVDDTSGDVHSVTRLSGRISEQK